jgi:hypothetical protein
MKSLAHPEWPYEGTPHEWRGFGGAVERIMFVPAEQPKAWPDFSVDERENQYQRLNFGQLD